MTWSEWNTSSYNTTGKRASTVTDSSGNTVSLDTLIVAGAAYEVMFVKQLITFSVYINEQGAFADTYLFKTYTAEEGMTWLEWSQSDYYPPIESYQPYVGVYADEITYNSNDRYTPSAPIYNDVNLSTKTLPTDIIIASNDYYTDWIEY